MHVSLRWPPGECPACCPCGGGPLWPCAVSVCAGRRSASVRWFLSHPDPCTHPYQLARERTCPGRGGHGHVGRGRSADDRLCHHRRHALAQRRSRQLHGPPVRCGRYPQSVQDALRRRGGGRHLEDHQQRHHLASRVRRQARHLDGHAGHRAHATRSRCGPAPASPTRATPSSRAAASTSPPTAASPGRRRGSRRPQHIGRIVVHPTNPNIRVRGRAGRGVAQQSGARAVSAPPTAATPGSW